ncbi:Wzz/FepE/Etk N-terminal domain-containing protein [Campylobacter corcagiensis]|uniref:Polysaccharide chain length determinant N-terminal domain-containing protein n=1 Tax=Campylobacter corcagiensis TaxID=1448857 RepID=A0A7M1LE35_9BACT|nr:Wzz/FepE/Etk N-terminal domain-containing protein [Campylobacter corcagiensis]QKF65041.1 putative chain length determinant protein, Wzz family [Campylobacter corcagiensis]QOQ86808.1 hypothetical protein IMC76_06200 [Campylobacter corcagiensis]
MDRRRIEIQDDEIDLAVVFKTLFDYKFTIVIITFIFLLIGVIYAITSTKWLKTTAIVEVGHHFTNNNEQYIANFSNFRNDVLAYGISVLDQNETDFKDIYVDYNLTTKDDSANKVFEDGFYAINIIGKNKDKSLEKIDEILKQITIKHKNNLEYILAQKSIDLEILNKNIEDTKNIILANANYQIKILQEEAPKIAEKIEQISKILIEKDNIENKEAVSSIQIGGSDYGLSSLIQYRNNIITNSISDASTRLFDIQMLLENMIKQKNDLEKDIKDGYRNTKVMSVATTPEKNKNLLIIAILTFIGFFVSIFSVLVWNVVKKI